MCKHLIQEQALLQVYMYKTKTQCNISSKHMMTYLLRHLTNLGGMMTGYDGVTQPWILESRLHRPF